MAIEEHGFSNQIRIAAETCFPRDVTDDRYRIGVGHHVLRLIKSSPFECSHTENIEIISGDQIAPYALVVAATAKTDRRKTIRVQPSHDIVLVAIVLVFWI